MKNFYILFTVLMLFVFSSQAQVMNGKLDDIKEFSTKITVPFVMPDGVKLFTDVYLPRVRDSMVVDLGIIPLPSPFNSILGDTIHTVPVTFIPLGAQIIEYPTLNGSPNPNPFQLPTVFTRTPYDKGDFDELGGIMPILGYNYILQDMRGRYSSEGVYFPMYSDSWNKNPYHPGVGHVLDYLPSTDPKHSNKHEDGYESIKIISTLDSAYAAAVGVTGIENLYAGYPHTSTRINNGSIGMFGASALGNTQLQLGLAHHTPDSIPHLKCLMPIVATTEHYISTGYNNGVFRDRIVTGWLKGQIFSGTDDDLIPSDHDKQNTVHTSFDYNLPQTITLNGITRTYEQNKFEAANLSIDHFTAIRYLNSSGVLANCGFYPNSVGRPDMDGSQASVNAIGEAVNPVTQTPLADLNYSRYRNMDVPILHITGWWDIFTEGQINNSNFSRDALTGVNKQLQKSVIGPWAHQTIASRLSGDRYYPKNVTDLTKIDLSNFNINNVPINDIVKSDLVTWFRYNLNYHSEYKVDEPKFIIQESKKWQLFSNATSQHSDIYIRVPAKDFVVDYPKMLNFLGGNGSLDNLDIELKFQFSGTDVVIPLKQPVPNLGTGLTQFAGHPLDSIPERDFLNDVPNYRFYVVGPDSMADVVAGYPNNSTMGNYWMGTDKFPPSEHIEWKKLFLHQNGALDASAPIQDEGYKTYVSDPDDPILTVGGSNMIVRSPDGTRNSQSQMELTDPTNAPYTMDREGVIQFNSAAIQDSFTIIGLPVCTLYAKSNPGGVTSGPTDTDWDMRICDVWPDGRVYFVQEGIVGARGRDWARSLVDQMGVAGAPTYANGVEDPGDKDIPYSNINIGQIYEYVFKMMPIGYTFAKGHKIRVLISSTNYTRYQANPNLPLNDGEFFRRKPGDGQYYIFDGQPMYPRVAVQRVHFSPENPTSINFPVYNQSFQYNQVPKLTVDSKFDISVFPNPAVDKIQIFANMEGEHEVIISDITGRRIASASFDDNVIFNTETFGKGIYFATVTDVKNPAYKATKKFTVQ